MAGSGKTFPPFAEGLIGGDQHRASFVSGADEFEQHAGLGLVKWTREAGPLKHFALQPLITRDYEIENAIWSWVANQ